MKFTKITNGNISLIKFRIQKFIETNQVVSMNHHYPYAKFYNRFLGLSDKSTGRRIEDSRESFIMSDDYKIEIDKSFSFTDDFIRLTFSGGSSAAIIDIGMKIKITPSHIFIREKSLLMENMGYMQVTLAPALHKKQKAIEQASYDRKMGEIYDVACQEEYNQELASSNGL